MPEVVGPVRPMPGAGELRFTLRTRQWPASARLLAFPVGFGLGPVLLWAQGKTITGVVAGYFWIASGLAVGSLVLCALLLRARRGPDFGIADDGVWLRPSPWRRAAVFTGFGELVDVEVRPWEEPGRFLVGAAIRVRTVDGSVPRRPRLVPCRRVDYRRLANATASIGLLAAGAENPKEPDHDR